MSHWEMLILPGKKLGISFALNQRASSISSSSIRISPESYAAVKPSISEFGYGHGWLPK